MCPFPQSLAAPSYTRSNMAGCSIRLKRRKPEWLNTLLCSKFFDSCGDHHDLRKNEKNMFCIDCNIGVCKHCMASSSSSSSPHRLHRWLQICKCAYHDVVRLREIQKHLDCSKIQIYKNNGFKAIHLNPKDAKIPKSKGGATCEACGRHIQDSSNSFCSIACKVSMVKDMFEEKNQKPIKIPISEFAIKCLKENENGDQSFLSLSESSEVIQTWWSSKLKAKKHLHKRKGVPHRAPLR